jgi:uncharacterized membrane protein
VRRVGLILLAIGIAGFLLATYERTRYDSGEAALRAAASPAARRTRDAWEDARWYLAGTAVIGIVFTVLPGKRET